MLGDLAKRLSTAQSTIQSGKDTDALSLMRVEAGEASQSATKVNLLGVLVRTKNTGRGLN